MGDEGYGDYGNGKFCHDSKSVGPQMEWTGYLIEFGAWWVLAMKADEHCLQCNFNYVSLCSV